MCSDTTDVVFLLERDSDDVFAVFPGLASTVDRLDLMTCYASIGQHSSASFEYCGECNEVTDPAEYADLAAELLRIGYNVCVVRMDSMGDIAYADERRKQLAY